MRYEVVASRRWFNSKNGQFASIYGSCPYYNNEDKKDWSIIEDGFSIRDNKTNTVGLGKRPHATRELAEAHAQKLNSL